MKGTFVFKMLFLIFYVAMPYTLRCHIHYTKRKVPPKIHLSVLKRSMLSNKTQCEVPF